jgi:hypothetical protein
MRNRHNPRNMSLNTINFLAGAQRRPSPKPPFGDHYQTHCCVHCNKRTVRKHRVYDMPCCTACEKALYRYITLTGALKKYHLNRDDLALLNYVERPNPYSSALSPMQLYLLAEIEALAQRKFQ